MIASDGTASKRIGVFVMRFSPFRTLNYALSETVRLSSSIAIAVPILRQVDAKQYAGRKEGGQLSVESCFGSL